MNGHIEPPNFSRQDLISLKEATRQSWDAIVEKAASTATNGKDPIPKRFIKLINDGFRQGHSTDHYAKALQTTRSNLRKACKSNLGEPPCACISNRLMMEAHQLLEKPNNTIKKTALTLGFNDPGYFTKVFRKYCGVSPKKYRSIFFSAA